MRALLVLTAAVIVLTGCVAPMTLTRADTTQEEFMRDKAQCWYEAKLATSGYGTAATRPGLSNAIAQGIGEGIAEGQRNRELTILCLKAKGYEQKPI